MSKLDFEYIPLTFISDKEEIKKQIRNTLILIYLFEKYKSPVRLETMIEGTQYGYNASALASGKNKFLRISDIYESKVNWKEVPYCDCDDEETYLLKKDDILIARTGGTTGKSFKIDDEPPAHAIYAGYLIRIRAKETVNPDYIYLFLHSFAYWSQIVNLNERNFRPKANAENLKALIIPDCPNNIQNDIIRVSQGKLVKGYEELNSKIESTLLEYDKTQEIEELLSDQILQLELLSAAILQEAVQGKLVEQKPQDEFAEELLNRIKAERPKSGKKGKLLLPVKNEEIPFGIPKNWIWCRLDELRDFNYSLSYGVLVPGNNFPDGIPFVRVQDLDNADKNEPPSKLIAPSIDLQYAKTRLVGGEILICVVGSIGKIALSSDNWIGANIARAVCRYMPNKNVSREYLYYCLNSPYVQNFFHGGKKSINPTLNVNILETTLVPLPSLAEQKRIVSEVERRLLQTRYLKEFIISNQQSNQELLKAVLHQAFQLKELIIQ